ncbi:MAG: hypothetical protein A2V70_10485 [Planctomycetes bacterium RBG_13_63_9]|nr:MAG: hypothetical protein A2V70_10485 [Planctomycetes bacterium RBG_13_63_9]
MNNDVEEKLRRLTPCGAAAQLRQEVLDAVADELAVAATRPPRPRIGLAVAASLLLAIALNVWVGKAADARLARLYGPRPVPRQIVEIAGAVAAVTDAETGRQVQQQLLIAWHARCAASQHGFVEYGRILNELVVIGKDRGHETAEENPRMDRDHRRHPARDTSGWQRDLGLDHQFTA